MKITDDRKTEIAFANLVEDLLAKYEIIFFECIDNNNFIFKPLNRKDYKSIVLNPELNDFQKEDEVCAKCVVWPDNVDWDNVEAGIPTKLFKVIMEKSFLDSDESQANLIEQCRENLSSLDGQMVCIISEAFPNYDIEDIEAWDMIKFCKIFTQAEWKLKNLRGLENILDVTECLRNINYNNDYEDDDIEEDIDNIQYSNKENNNINHTNSSGIKVGNRTMTQEEYAQYKAFREQHPEIDWDADAMFTGYETETVDTVPVALRTRR